MAQPIQAVQIYFEHPFGAEREVLREFFSFAGCLVKTTMMPVETMLEKHKSLVNPGSERIAHLFLTDRPPEGIPLSKNEMWCSFRILKQELTINKKAILHNADQKISTEQFEKAALDVIIRRIWKDEGAETQSLLYINAAFWQLDLFEFLQIKSTFQALKMGELMALPMRGHYYLPEAVYLNKMADAFINMAKQCSVGPSSIYAVYAYVNAQRHLRELLASLETHAPLRIKLYAAVEPVQKLLSELNKIYRNDLATVAPKVAAMLSEKDKHFAFEVTAGSKRKLVFVCPNCGQEFEATIQNVVRSVNHNLTGCPVCAGKKIVPGVNDLASKYPEIAAMWSGKNKLSASEVAVKSNKKVFFKCRDCGKEFETKIEHVVYAVENGTTGCPVCNGRKVVPGINDLASRYPKVAAMWSNKNEKSALEVTAKTDKKAIFKCPDCGKEFKAQIGSVVDSVNNGFTGCYDCNRRRINAISKPECFVVRFMLSFAGENGIANPFSDVQNILGDGHLGLDFVDHIQKFCAEYNGSYPHKDKAQKDRFKFEAARKAGYAMIRVLEPGLEVLDPKYDIVMPEGFYHSGKYDAEIMEEVGRKVIHLLEEIYGRKASPEIWALNNFKEFEIWYDANKKELEADARKKGPKGKTAMKKAA